MTTRKRKRTHPRHRRSPPEVAVTPDNYVAGLPMCADCGVNQPMRTATSTIKLCVDCHERL